MNDEHSHPLPIIRDVEEGWEWCGGVPDGVEDGWFCQDLAELGPVPADEDGGNGGRIEVWASDGHAVLAWQGDETLSLEQMRRFRALLDQAIAVLEAYQPPAWMLDPEQLHKRKVEAEEASICRVEVACPACSQESTP